MKKLTSIVSIVCLVALCFTLFASCAGNSSKVDDYVEKLNTEDNFINVKEIIDETLQVKKVSETIISENRIQILSVDYKYVDGKEKEEIKRVEKYYEILEDGKVRVYSTFDCEEHKKDGKAVKEWKFDDMSAVEAGMDIKALRAALRGEVALFDLKSENLEWNKDVKGFVFVDGKNVPGFEDVVITAKSGALTMSYKQAGFAYKSSFMNFGTARVAFPMLCATYANKLK